MTSVSTELATSKVTAVEKQASRRFRRVPGYIIAYIILVLGVVVSLFPYLLALLTALKQRQKLTVIRRQFFTTRDDIPCGQPARGFAPTRGRAARGTATWQSFVWAHGDLLLSE